MPSEVRDVTIAIDEFCDNIIRIFNETGAYKEGAYIKRKDILEKIEERFYDRFSNASRYYLDADLIPIDIRNIIHRFIIDCKYELSKLMYIDKLTLKGTLQVQIGEQYKRLTERYNNQLVERLKKFYGVEESKAKDILNYIINSGLAIEWHYLKDNILSNYLIFPAPYLSNEILRLLKRVRAKSKDEIKE